MHPALAGTLESAAKRARMVDTILKHLKYPGVVVVDEIGIENHRNQTLNTKIPLAAYISVQEEG